MSAGRPTRAIVIVLLTLSFARPDEGAATPVGTVAPGQESHNSSHPFVLQSDTDFLVAMIALYEQSLEASLVMKEAARTKKIKSYATKMAVQYRAELARLRMLLTRHGGQAKPDFHFAAVMSELPTLSGAAAEKRYLNGASMLAASKMELAEFAVGIAKAREVKRLAQDVLDRQGEELSTLNRWLANYERARK